MNGDIKVRLHKPCSYQIATVDDVLLIHRAFHLLFGFGNLDGIHFSIHYYFTRSFGAKISVEIVNAIGFYSVEMLESAQVGTGTYTNVLISMDRE